MRERIDFSIRLNSSKTVQAPLAARPLKKRQIPLYS